MRDILVGVSTCIYNSKIYEKNGRVDLARGLKANMKKASAQKVPA